MLPLGPETKKPRTVRGEVEAQEESHGIQGVQLHDLPTFLSYNLGDWRSDLLLFVGFKEVL